jgi:acylphosphatase
MLRQKVLYSGNVQGVGFRQAVASMAKQLPLEGWVRNLPDGRVELAVQGDPPIVRKLLDQIVAEAPGRITSVQAEEWTTPLTTSGFHIRFDLNP